MTTANISIADAETLLTRALVATGVPRAAAASLASALVHSEAEGQVGQGFSRLGDYVAQVRSRKIRAGAEVEVLQVHPGSIMVDAGGGFAFPALDWAIDLLVPLARAQGVAVAGVARSYHCGALSVQVNRIARQGLIGLVMADTPAGIAPEGAREPVFGTNPIAFAVPRAGGAPLVADLSLLRVARGKVLSARKSGQTIPEGWALDKDWQPTTDPEAGLAGSMVPIGEAKGTALALLVEVLAAVFTGANLSSEAWSFFEAEGRPPGTGQFLLALRPHDDVSFAGLLERLLVMITNLNGARLPGARRAKTLQSSRHKGLQVPVAKLQSIRELAGSDG